VRLWIFWWLVRGGVSMPCAGSWPSRPAWDGCSSRRGMPGRALGENVPISGDIPAWWISHTAIDLVVVGPEVRHGPEWMPCRRPG
jgi:hypothetical protein